ncbi:MAG: amino acid ABC transporter permease [Lentilactobacillus diolivorans]|uniref:ABC transporter permease n=2 Tax=Lentilactobacillus diolivorans TaxID=179838 RepID=A0A0R1SB14_9LACO|nr:amino acid ABC transporter permease [Lentilactobacillus diolivorans]KRL64548.1 ABC transporter permease [Lentilactobacillus diolivorans DSM 14421]GEP22885.1 glutamine ABC transporter permease [Lentilactobacillus diolivorans]
MHNFSDVIGLFKQLLTGLPITLGFIISSWIIGFSLSVLVTAGRLSPRRWLRYPLDVLVSFTRSIPIVLQLFLVYYGLPALVQTLIGVDLNDVNKMIFCIITFSIYYGSYLSEILRPAYLSVRKEQHDAAYGLGYTKFQTNFHVIVPQMFSIALPSLGNEVINLVHQSSILFVLGTVDLMGQADMIITTDYTSSPLLTYFCAGMIYWGLTIVITAVVHSIERYVDRYKQSDLEGGTI